MSADRRLKVVLCWHMHQPCYFDPGQKRYQLPWTYLHAVKDYVDMAAHLEAVPAARAVVNFAPILLEQIDDYTRQVRAFLATNEPIGDMLLNALAQPELPQRVDERVALMQSCLRANEQRLIKRFPDYVRLVELMRAVQDDKEALGYLNDQFLADLLVWYHLAWIAECVRRSDTRVQQLQSKGRGYTAEDRRLLVRLIGELLNSVIPRYRRLAEQGQVELSVTPYAHPILPLLLDLRSARQAIPDVHLPVLDHYPNGDERAQWHLRRGVEVFERYFGFRPHGCWPSEGSVSDAALGVLADGGFRWAASGEQVLRNSLGAHHATTSSGSPVHRPYRVATADIACFFRDDGLSDLIGFSYSNWHADDAVANLVQHLETIGRDCAQDPSAVVSIIMDGENAWEYYPENAYYFLSALYQRLSRHPGLELTTFSRCLDQAVAPRTLGSIVAGSWVYGTFSTWIGDRDKNHAWEMLGEAKLAVDEALESGAFSPERRAQIEQQLALCEGSDWFWWFGDYNPSDTVRDFDRLYRLHLTRLYELIGRAPPGYLSYAFSRGGGAQEAGGVMRRGSQ